MTVLGETMLSVARVNVLRDGGRDCIVGLKFGVAVRKRGGIVWLRERMLWCGYVGDWYDTAIAWLCEREVWCGYVGGWYGVVMWETGMV